MIFFRTCIDNWYRYSQKWNRHLFVLTPHKLYYSEEQETPRDEDDDYDENSEDKQNRLDVSTAVLSQGSLNPFQFI